MNEPLNVQYLTKLSSPMQMTIRFDVTLMRNVHGGCMLVYQRKAHKICGKSKGMEEITHV